MALSVSETCFVLGISRSTVYRMFQQGRLRGVHIGRRVLVPVAEIERLIESSGGQAPTWIATEQADVSIL